MKTLKILVLLFIATLSFSAQFEIVKDVAERPGDLSVQQYPVKDVNGDWCALLKVFTDIKDLQFKGTGYEKHDYRDGTYYVYMFNDSKNLTFIKDSYTTKPHNFPISLKSNVVYGIELKGVGEKMENIAIVVQTEPSDAKIFIDDKEYSKDMQVPIGKHTLKVTKEGYEPYIKEIEVSPTNIHFPVKLERVQEANIYIESNPTGATVFMDGISLGKTPLNIFHTTGTYNLRIVKEDYVDLAENIEINYPKTEKTFALQKNRGSITVKTSPEKQMDIYIDGSNSGFKSDHTFTDLMPKTYKIKAQSEFYITEEKEIQLTVGSQENLELISETNFGYITINTHERAQVLLNGEKLNNLNKIKLAPQRCVIEVKMRKAPDITETYLLRKGEDKVFNLYPQVPTGIVQVTVIPNDAKIELYEEGGEKYTAVGAGNFKDVPVGNYNLTITKDKFKTYSKAVKVEEGKTASETGIRLEEIKEVMVEINSEPEGAEVYLDNKNMGTTPFSLLLPIKEYNLSVRNKGYKNYESNIKLTNRDYYSQIDLDKIYQLNSKNHFIGTIPLIGSWNYNISNQYLTYEPIKIGWGWSFYEMNEIRLYLLGWCMRFYYKPEFTLDGHFAPVSIEYRRHFKNSNKSIGLSLISSYFIDGEYLESGIKIDYGWNMFRFALIYTNTNNIEYTIDINDTAEWESYDFTTGGLSFAIYLEAPSNIFLNALEK